MATETTKIMFKRGKQGSLPTKAEDGVFYLTTDTNRLYVGQGSDKAPVLLNQTVQIVANVDSLPNNPTLNDFYYCTAENILAVYTGTGATYDKSKWQQINPDTNTNDDTYVTSVTAGTKTVTDNTSVVYPFSIKQTKKDVDGKTTELQSTVDFSVEITKDDLEAIIHDPANVGLTAETITNGAKISTQGEGSNNAEFINIKNGSNVTVSVSGDDISIAATDTTYDIKTVTADGKSYVRLYDNVSKANDDIEFAAGTGLAVSAASDGTKITYSHANYSSSKPEAADGGTLDHKEAFDVVTDVTYHENGHINTITRKRFTLPEDTTLDTTNTKRTGSWTAQIQDTSSNKSTISFVDDANALQTALEKKISDGLAAANTALTYKGTISNYNSLTTKTNVEVGDVWLLDAHDATNNKNYRKGDLFIATAEEGATITNGVIEAGKVVWTYVPSGDDLNTDTKYYGDVTIGTNKVTYGILPQKGADGEDPGSLSNNENLVINAGNDITITQVAGKNNEVSIAHETFKTDTATKTADSKQTFTAITGVTVDNGHITKVDKHTFTPETYSLGLNTSGDIALTNGSGAELGTVSIDGDGNYIDTSSDSGIKVSHKELHAAAVNADQANNNTTSLSAEGTFKTITGVQYDKAGHISSISTQTLTLPKDNDTTYKFFAAGSPSAEAGAAASDPYFILRDNNKVNQAIQLKGDGGSLSVSGTADSATISLVWGTF